MLNKFFFKKEKHLIYEEKEKEELLKAMCILEHIYLVIGKSNGFLSIYKIYDNNKIIDKQIHAKTITFLMPYEKRQTSFFSCSEEPTIKLLELRNDNNTGFEIKIVKKIIKHQSCVKKLEYLDNNYFASCSTDCSFIMWNLEKKQNKLKIIDSSGIENFFLKMKNKSNGSFERLITLNKKRMLSLYVNRNEKPFLEKFITDIDHTNNNSIIKIKEKLFIGGYEYLQIISAKNLQCETKVKFENAISYIYDSGNKFLVLGLKNGRLKFIKKKTIQQLNLQNLKDIEESRDLENNINDKKYFKFSNLCKANENEIQLYEDESILLFNIYNKMLFCISDETIKVYKTEIEKKEKVTSENKQNKRIFFPTNSNACFLLLHRFCI